MKGVCIILVMGTHVSEHFFSPHLNNMLQAFRIPLYYFLSGLFFKTYDGFWDFTRRKFNNIIVPFIFFFLLSGVVYSIRCQFIIINPADASWSWSGICDQLLDPLFERSYRLNVPLWFLLSLFEVNLLFYPMKKYLNKWVLYALVVAMSILGWNMADDHKTFPLVADTILVGLPYFVLGNIFKEHGLVTPNRYDKYGWLTLPPLIVFLYYFASPLNIRDQILPPYVQLYATTMLAISCLFWACKPLPKIPIISYIGRYSIIVLGTHCIMLFLAYTIANLLFIKSSTTIYVIFAVLFVLELMLIPLFVRYFPRFTAQKELIKPFTYDDEQKMAAKRRKY